MSSQNLVQGHPYPENRAEVWVSLKLDAKIAKSSITQPRIVLFR